MKAKHIIRNSLLTGICVGLLTGCSWLDDWPPKGSDMAARTAPKPPQSKMEQTSAGTWKEQGSAQDNAMATQAGPKGVSIDDEAAQRIARLESAVEGIRGDMQMMMPALTKLAEAQGDIQKLLGQVEPAAGPMAKGTAGGGGYENYNGEYGAPMPIARDNAPAALTPPRMPSPDQGQQQYERQSYQPPQQQNSGPQPGSVAWYEQQERQVRQQQQQPPAYQAPPPSYQQASYGGAAAGAAVTNVRFGEHGDKTRLVLDASGAVAFSYNVDNNDMILTISLPGTGWQGARQMSIANSPLVGSYQVVPDNAGGHQVIMQLRRPVHVLWSQALEPGGQQGHRVVFDIAPL